MPSSQRSRWVLTASVIRAKPKLSCVRMQGQAISFWQYKNETLTRIAQIWLISGLWLQSRSFSGNPARDLPQVLEARPSWDSTLHRQMASYKPGGVGNTQVGSYPTLCFIPYVEKWTCHEIQRYTWGHKVGFGSYSLISCLIFSGCPPLSSWMTDLFLSREPLLVYRVVTWSSWLLLKPLSLAGKYHSNSH